MLFFGNEFSGKDDCQTQKRGRKKPILVTLVWHFGVIPMGGTSHSHGGNNTKVPY